MNSYSWKDWEDLLPCRLTSVLGHAATAASAHKTFPSLPKLPRRSYLGAAHLSLKPAFLKMSLSCFSTTALPWVPAVRVTSPYFRVAPHRAQETVSEGRRVLGTLNLSLPQRHLTVMVPVVIGRSPD